MESWIGYWKHCALDEKLNTFIGAKDHSSRPKEATNLEGRYENQPNMGFSNGRNNPFSMNSSFENKTIRQLTFSLKYTMMKKLEKKSVRNSFREKYIVYENAHVYTKIEHEKMCEKMHEGVQKNAQMYRKNSFGN